MPAVQINYLAVLVAALATFFLGALWYSPILFAKAWMRAHDYTPEKLHQMKKKPPLGPTLSHWFAIWSWRVSYPCCCPMQPPPPLLRELGSAFSPGWVLPHPWA